MKFYLCEADEDGKIIAKDVHFYGNPKDGFFIFDGKELVPVDIKIVSRFIKDNENKDRKPLDPAAIKAKKAKIKKIKDEINGGKVLKDFKSEEENRYIDFIDPVELGDEPKTDDRLEELVEDITDFIASQTGVVLGDKMGRPHPLRIDPSIIKKRRKPVHSLDTPKVDVYFDRSGSWSDEFKTKLGWDAIATLQEYDRMGVIALNVYFFAVTVGNNEGKILSEGLNSGPEILEYIRESAPDNLVIMTDRHLLYPDAGKAAFTKTSGPIVTVPGAVWGIFVSTSEKDIDDTMQLFVSEADHAKSYEFRKY